MSAWKPQRPGFRGGCMLAGWLLVLASAMPASAAELDGGADRGLASSALAAARAAVTQAPTEARNRDEAAARLAHAEALFESSRYGEAASEADAAWQLVSSKAGGATRFAVQVGDDGKTTITPREGHAVQVEAQGSTQAVYPGQSVSVERGHEPVFEGGTPPPAVPATLEAPFLVSPQDATLLRVKPTPNGPGSVQVSWTPIAGAKSYEVEVLPAGGKGKPQLVTVAKAEARLPLPPGKYRWWVRAVGTSAKSPASLERSFEIEAEDLKLNVKPNTWK